MNYWRKAFRKGVMRYCILKILEFLKRFWPSLLTLGVILYATLDSDPLSEEPMLWEIPYFDKWVHAIMMGGLVGAIAFDWQRCHRRANVLTPRTMWLFWLGVCIFGALDELGQKAMDNGRGCELLDYCADVAGATVAVFLAPPVIRRVIN